MKNNNGVVNIHGREYKTVALRVAEFRELYGNDLGLETELVHNNQELVVMKAIIKNKDGRIVGTGWAEEYRGSSNINKTSALENCETSAIGRALASIGLAGSEYATANEVSDAIIQQKQLQATEAHIKYMDTVRDCYDEITAIKEALANDLIDDARAIFKQDLDPAHADILWKAPSKGGIFTTEERRKLTEGK